MPTILMVGRNRQLAMTRAMILKRAPAEVIESDPISAAQILKEGRISLVVLCHTLMPEEMTSIARVARDVSPRVRVLQLIAGHQATSKATPEIDEIVPTQPERLYAKVSALLN